MPFRWGSMAARGKFEGPDDDIPKWLAACCPPSLVLLRLMTIVGNWWLGTANPAAAAVTSKFDRVRLLFLFPFCFSRLVRCLSTLWRVVRVHEEFK
jgi:hypothetical protein